MAWQAIQRIFVCFFVGTTWYQCWLLLSCGDRLKYYFFAQWSPPGPRNRNRPALWPNFWETAHSYCSVFPHVPLLAAIPAGSPPSHPNFPDQCTGLALVVVGALPSFFAGGLSARLYKEPKWMLCSGKQPTCTALLFCRGLSICAPL